MAFHDLRAFLERLEAAGRLRRVAAPVDPDLESTPFCLRAQRSGGHALLFGQPGRSKHPLLGNLFGAPYDEPSVLALALNDMFVPILRKVCPQVVDFYLPPEACSYRVTVVSIRKQYPGHARRVMMGIWSYLRQFTYTKFVIVTDDDIDVRDWAQVIWAVSTRVDPARDSLIVENTPIDFLDFSSPVPNLGSKLGLDATHKWPGGDDAAMESPDRARSGRRATRGRALESGLRAAN